MRTSGAGCDGCNGDTSLEAVDQPTQVESTLRDVMAEREGCARMLEMSRQELRLLAGEMTAQELRTVIAVLANRASAIRARSEAK